MPDIEIHRAHHLGRKAARVAAEKMADHLGRKFGLTGEWAGDVLSFQRPGVTGSLTITDKDLALSVSLGFLLKAMKGSIETAIREELDQLFAGAKPKKAPPRPKKGR